MPPGASDCSFMSAMAATWSAVISVLSKTTPTLKGVEEAATKKKIRNSCDKKDTPTFKEALLKWSHFQRAKLIFIMLLVSLAETMLMLTIWSRSFQRGTVGL